MARTLGGTPTEANPFRNRYDISVAIDVDITSTGGAAPVQIPVSMLAGTMLTIATASDNDDVNPEWHLIAADLTLGTAGTSDVVMVTMPVQLAPAATARRQQLAGAAGLFMNTPGQFDLRSLVERKNWTYYLAVAFKGGEAGDVYLVDLWATSRAL